MRISGELTQKCECEGKVNDLGFLNKIDSQMNKNILQIFRYFSVLVVEFIFSILK